MSCPTAWKKIRMQLKKRHYFINSGGNGQVQDDAPSIIRRWYNSLVAAERAAYESVGLGTLADMNQLIRKHTIENPRFILDVAQIILTGGNPFSVILRRLQNDDRESQSQPIPEYVLPERMPPDMSQPLVSVNPSRTMKIPGVPKIAISQPVPVATQPVLTASTRRSISQPPRRTTPSVINGRTQTRPLSSRSQEEMFRDAVRLQLSQR